MNRQFLITSSIIFSGMWLHWVLTLEQENKDGKKSSARNSNASFTLVISRFGDQKRCPETDLLITLVRRTMKLETSGRYLQYMQQLFHLSPSDAKLASEDLVKGISSEWEVQSWEEGFRWEELCLNTSLSNLPAQQSQNLPQYWFLGFWHEAAILLLDAFLPKSEHRFPQGPNPWNACIIDNTFMQNVQEKTKKCIVASAQTQMI